MPEIIEKMDFFNICKRRKRFALTGRGMIKTTPFSKKSCTSTSNGDS